MKREFLKNLGIEGLTPEIIDQIMNEHGNTVNENKKAGEDAIKALQAKYDARADITPDALKELKAKVETTEETLKTFEGVDVEKLKNDLTALNTTLSEKETEYKTKISELETDSAIREKMATINFSSEYARKGVYSDIKAKVKYEDGKLTGFEDVIKELKEREPNAFKESKDEPFTLKKDEGKPHTGNDKPIIQKDIPILI